MTSRQPGSVPPGTRGHAALRWPVLVLPVTVLIIVGLAGLLGAGTGPQWDGPLHGDPLAVGLALEGVLGILLVITVRRLATRARARAVKTAPASAMAVKLRQMLVVVLGAGMVAVAVTIPVGLDQHVFSRHAGTQRGQAAAGSFSSAAAQGHNPFHLHLFTFLLHIHLTTYLLYGLLALVFLGGVVLRVWWVRQYRRPGMTRAYHYLVPDSQDLLEVVESGRSALRAIDDARAAIIACYVAMEASLDEHGAARVIADTPDELLTRATALGIVRGTAAARLTALFYEARFSSHPLDRGHRHAAAQALAELAAELAEAEVGW